MVESKYIKDFENWCKRERIKVDLNNEVFFINERKTLVPTFRLGNKIFVHIVDDLDIKDYPMYQLFANSFYTLIVIPKVIIPDMIKYLSKDDIFDYFKIRL